MYTNVQRVMLGDGANSGVVTHLKNIAKGDLFLLDKNHNFIANATLAAALKKFDYVYIAQGIGAGKAILSSPIQGNTVSAYKGTGYVAPAEMVAALGYNGTAGTIAVTAGVEYRLRVLIKDEARTNGQRQTMSDVNYTAGASDTVITVLEKMTNLFYQKDYGHNAFSGLVKVERTSDGTRTAFAVGANADVTKGSNAVTFGAAHTLNVGDIIKLQGSTYVVKTVPSTTTITLDTPYQGESEVILVADADSGVYTTVANWGVKITAIAQESKTGIDEYEWVIFDAAFTDANDLASAQYTATYTVLTATQPGQGYWKQVRDAEEAAKGRWGDTSKRRFDDNRIASNVVEDQTYNSIIIEHADIHGGNFQDTYRAPLQTTIYLPDGSDQSDYTTATSFLAVLNGYFSDVVGYDSIDIA